MDLHLVCFTVNPAQSLFCVLQNRTVHVLSPCYVWTVLSAYSQDPVFKYNRADFESKESTNTEEAVKRLQLTIQSLLSPIIIGIHSYVICFSVLSKQH